MTVRIWTKPETQAALRALSAAGLPATKAPSGKYEVLDCEGRVVFRALPGERSYLVTHAEGLFRYAGEVPVANAG